jgi:ABC-2 type transport system permease protein
MGMIRIKATLKVSLIGIVSQWKVILLIYAVFPLVLAIGIGYFQKDIFLPQTVQDKIAINFIDQDNSSFSKGLTALFQSDELKKLFKFTDKADYVITIPKGYEANIMRLRSSTMKIEENHRSSSSNELILKSILNQYGNGITEAVTVANKTQALKIKEKALVTVALKQISSENALKPKMLRGERILTSYENQAVTLMTFMFFTILLGCVAAYHLDKENGCFKRLLSSPITKAAFFNLDLLIFFVTSFVYGAVYVLAFSVTGLSFKGVNPINIFAILVGQSLLITSLSGLIIAFLNKQNSNIVIIIFMYSQIIFGGGFIPVKEISNEVFTKLSTFAPGNILSEAYKNCILFNSFRNLVPYLLVMLSLSIAIYIISILKVKIRWEE